jgi:O-acetyl-ADP-ribose deacetylase (regulator of RNase III)
MINYKTGDLFNDNAEAIVNTVNCVGVMGRGIALQFKKRYPENFKEYEAKCKLGEMTPGRIFVFETNSFINPKYIINFPTKRHWRGASRIEDIESGLVDLSRVIKTYDIKSIAIPPLGSGLGGLDWLLVKSKIEAALIDIEAVEINVYEPVGAPKAEDMVRNKQVPLMTPGRAALVELIHLYLKGLLDPFITLLEIHKLMYFLQASGENLSLQYVKETYGPYAKNLSHVLNAVEGHMLSGYADGGNNPKKRLELIPGATDDAGKFLSTQPDTLKRMERVSELVDGFETPFGLELLATVHWLVENGADSLNEVIKETYAWNQHKTQFSPRQIEIALHRLISLQWVAPIEGLII